MKDLILFVHRQGSRKMTEIAVVEAMTVAELLGHRELQSEARDELFVFFGESEEPARQDGHVGCCHSPNDGRVHLTKCRHVKVTVYFTHLTHTREFPPGTRLKTVKAWAVSAFNVPAHDAIEHVLEIHGTRDRPSISEPLSVLVQGHDCVVAFDFVPDIRVEG